MQIKVIGYDKVKILIETEDILTYHIPLSAWKEGGTECEDFIYILLHEIYRQTGISFMQCEILTEITQGISDAYYIIMTKTAASTEESRAAVQVGERAPYFFAIEDLSHLLQVASIFNEELRPCSSKLYRYRGRYYLVLSFSGEISNSQKEFFIARTEEFATRVTAKTDFAQRLTEYAVRIGGEDVLQALTCPK